MVNKAFVDPTLAQLISACLRYRHGLVDLVSSSKTQGKSLLGKVLSKIVKSARL